MSLSVKPPPRILSIAGSDSSGGAGIQADIKTITMLGGYAMTAITAVTAQNTLGVHAAAIHSAECVRAQIESCLSDIGADAVKIGMLGSPEIAEHVADALTEFSGPIVFDPVIAATSGSILANDPTITTFPRLMALATITTPNIAELEMLGGDQALESIAQTYLATGGDADSGTITDRLVQPGRAQITWSAPKINSRHTHGTGCTLSSAIATFLGFGLALEDAVTRARECVRLALREAPGLGAQSGPLGHHNVRMDLTGEPRLNQITVFARDYGEAVEFYQTLGLTLIVDSPANGYARLESSGGVTLSVHTEHSGGTGAAMYFECLDLDAFTAALTMRGIACPAPQEQSWNWRECWIADPSGNPICLYQAGENRRYPPWRIRE